MAEGAFVEVCAAPLSLERYVAAVADDGAGAIATFIGVTRDTFDGKRVLRLEYEAYEPMARCCCSCAAHRLRAL
jgi:molybdopterin synthase catalytic subunit